MDLITENDISHYLSSELAWQYRIIPYQIDGRCLVVLADVNEYKDTLIGQLELITGYEIAVQLEDSSLVSQLLSKIYRRRESARQDVLANEDVQRDDFLQKVVLEAKDLCSSDIHIECYTDKCRIRFRIDGKLLQRYRIHRDKYAAFINKVKIKAGLDIAEKRLPQDGRIMILDEGSRIDIRVSVLPTLYGEKIVLRLLGSDSEHIHLKSLGLNQKQLEDFQWILKKTSGIILISGPTGSGKTTTLYATLKLLNQESNNILTIEDPIEYTLDGVNQVQLKENIGLTFSSALRTFLRQDPDVIMLGEIRDSETAQMAIRAALTGHLVLSTIHTNSAWGTISRLIDMNVPAFLLANTLNMTVAQRLVRKLCIKCKQKIPFDGRFYGEIVGVAPSIVAHCIAVGCDACYYTGYSGRVALYEVIPIDTELALCIKDNVLHVDDLVKIRGITTLQSEALELVNGGLTSIEEIYPILLNM